MKSDFSLKTFCSEIVKKGVEALLPQNLSDEWVNELSMLGGKFLESECGEEALPAVILLAVLTIISHQRGNPQTVSIEMDELMRYIHIYVFDVVIEEINRKTDVKQIEFPTLQNIFDDKRSLTFRREV